MSISYPSSLDNFPNPTSTDLLENATLALDHDQQHSNANDAIEALEAKVGVNSSAVTTSHDYKLSGVAGSDKAVSKTGTETLTNKTVATLIGNAETISNLASGGSIGAAASTVDGWMVFNINQTTPGQVLTIPSPTTTTAGRDITINNVGTVSFLIGEVNFVPGYGLKYNWNGSAWIPQSGNVFVTVLKTADQTQTGTAVLLADTELTFNIGANETWFVDITIPFTTPTAAGLRVALNGPSGATGRASIIDTVTGNTNTAYTSLGTAMLVVNTGATSELVVLRGTVNNSSTPGAVYLSWAQSTSNGGNTIVHDQSFLVAYRHI